MKKCFIIIILMSFYLAYGQIIISEVMNNPDAVLDTDGEWFELYNSTSSTININGWTIRDDGSDSHIINNGGPLNVPEGGFIVLGRNFDNLTNGGVIVHYQYSGITLANSADELILLNDGNNEIDRVEWDGGPNFPDPTGASMYFNKTASDDNNIGSNWSTSTTAWPGSLGDSGSPGTRGEGSLPVELTYFIAEYSTEGIRLKWRTESEYENIGFILERKTKNTKWKEITNYKNNQSLLGQGTVSFPTNYEYIDHFVEQGKTYSYRLGDIDYGGKITYHNTNDVYVELNSYPSAIENIFITAYPNPFNPTTTIRYKLSEDAVTNIAIIDINGRPVNTILKKEQPQGWHEIQWNGKDNLGNTVSSGIYFYQVTINNYTKTDKLIFLQ